MITKNIIRRFVIILVLFCSISGMAGHQIRIEKINAIDTYPKVKIFITFDRLNDKKASIMDGMNLVIYEDGARNSSEISVKKQKESEQYLYLVFSIDSSKSISSKFLKSIKNSARDIAGCMGPNDKIAVFRFNDSVTLLNDFTRSTDEIIKSINSVKRHGKKTLLYNSIYDSIELFDKVKQINKKIIVFTDGKDEGSNVSDEDVIQISRKTGIPIYFICYRDSADIGTMTRISKLTDGKLIYCNYHESIAGMYRAILSAMKNRYIITYLTNLKPDGRNHEIELRYKSGETRDRDASLTLIEKKITGEDMLISSSTVFTGISFILLISIFLVVIYFLNREKKILSEKFEIEKKLIMGKCLVPGIGREVHGEEGKTAAFLEDGQGYTKACLFLKEGDETGKKYAIEKQEITLGRDKDNNVVIKDETVSEQQAKIKNVNGVYYLFDLISEYGSYLNGKKLLRPKALYDWDEIKLGRTILIFRSSVTWVD